MNIQQPDRAQIDPTVETAQLAFDAAADALLVLSNDGVVLHVNAAGLHAIEADSAQTAGGVRFGDLLTRHCQEEWHGLRERVAAGESRRLIVELVGLQGTHRWVEMHAAPTRIAGGGTDLLAACRACGPKGHRGEPHL